MLEIIRKDLVEEIRTQLVKRSNPQDNIFTPSYFHGLYMDAEFNTLYMIKNKDDMCGFVEYNHYKDKKIHQPSYVLSLDFLYLFEEYRHKNILTNEIDTLLKEWMLHIIKTDTEITDQVSLILSMECISLDGNRQHDKILAKMKNFAQEIGVQNNIKIECTSHSVLYSPEIEAITFKQAESFNQYHEYFSILGQNARNSDKINKDFLAIESKYMDSSDLKNTHFAFYQDNVIGLFRYDIYRQKKLLQITDSIHLNLIYITPSLRKQGICHDMLHEILTDYDIHFHQKLQDISEGHQIKTCLIMDCISLDGNKVNADFMELLLERESLYCRQIDNASVTYTIEDKSILFEKEKQEYNIT